MRHKEYEKTSEDFKTTQKLTTELVGQNLELYLFASVHEAMAEKHNKEWDWKEEEWVEIE